jgi:nucleotide-binding universal stress UspA family protein
MATQTTFRAPAGATTTPLGRRVLVGVDGSDQALEAARQAALLTDPGGAVTILAAWHASGMIGADPARLEAVRAAGTAAAAFAGLPEPKTRILCGIAWQALVREAVRRGATLVALGSNGNGRLRGIVTGSTATALVHKAPCSVLVARDTVFDVPARVVVGVDGSPESAAAFTAASEICERYHADLRPVVAGRGEWVDDERVTAILGRRYEPLDDDAVHALVSSSVDADLVVVGSRGLQGLKALGSVSERVAHEAYCSTLIVRPRSVRCGYAVG